eukprot:scaffold15514_cov129-Cylindrotheca_fusiformis.AAC.14
MAINTIALCSHTQTDSSKLGRSPSFFTNASLARETVLVTSVLPWLSQQSQGNNHIQTLAHTVSRDHSSQAILTGNGEPVLLHMFLPVLQIIGM